MPKRYEHNLLISLPSEREYIFFLSLRFSGKLKYTYKISFINKDETAFFIKYFIIILTTPRKLFKPS